MLFPPLRYGTVEDDIMRGAYPTLRNFRQLRRLQLRTLISLTPKDLTADLCDWCAHENINLMHHKVDRFSPDNTNVSPQLMASLLGVMINQANLPLYIHCLDGIQATGLVVMCLRKVQNWALPAIHSEFLRFAEADTLMPCVERFVDTFSEEILVTENLPPWLWGGARIPVHPVLKLKFDPPLVKDTARCRPTNKQNVEEEWIDHNDQHFKPGHQHSAGGMSSPDMFDDLPVIFESKKRDKQTNMRDVEVAFTRDHEVVASNHVNISGRSIVVPQTLQWLDLSVKNDSF